MYQDSSLTQNSFSLGTNDFPDVSNNHKPHSSEKASLHHSSAAHLCSFVSLCLFLEGKAPYFLLFILPGCCAKVLASLFLQIFSHLPTANVEHLVLLLAAQRRELEMHYDLDGRTAKTKDRPASLHVKLLEWDYECVCEVVYVHVCMLFQIASDLLLVEHLEDTTVHRQ